MELTSLRVLSNLNQSRMDEFTSGTSSSTVTLSSSSSSTMSITSPKSTSSLCSSPSSSTISPTCLPISSSSTTTATMTTTTLNDTDPCRSFMIQDILDKSKHTTYANQYKHGRLWKLNNEHGNTLSIIDQHNKNRIHLNEMNDSKFNLKRKYLHQSNLTDHHSNNNNSNYYKCPVLFEDGSRQEMMTSTAAEATTATAMMRPTVGEDCDLQFNEQIVDNELQLIRGNLKEFYSVTGKYDNILYLLKKNVYLIINLCVA
ncbi:unnamed protein product [Schistosoma turkestanicum]|nr:unnamed protein product [Schistosoma turkestanicum]